MLAGIFYRAECTLITKQLRLLLIWSCSRIVQWITRAPASVSPAGALGGVVVMYTWQVVSVVFALLPALAGSSATAGAVLLLSALADTTHVSLVDPLLGALQPDVISWPAGMQAVWAGLLKLMQLLGTVGGCAGISTGISAMWMLVAACVKLAVYAVVISIDAYMTCARRAAFASGAGGG